MPPQENQHPAGTDQQNNSVHVEGHSAISKGLAPKALLMTGSPKCRNANEKDQNSNARSKFLMRILVVLLIPRSTLELVDNLATNLGPAIKALRVVFAGMGVFQDDF